MISFFFIQVSENPKKQQNKMTLEIFKTIQFVASRWLLLSGTGGSTLQLLKSVL